MSRSKRWPDQGPRMFRVEAPASLIEAACNRGNRFKYIGSQTVEFVNGNSGQPNDFAKELLEASIRFNWNELIGDWIDV